MSSVGYPPSPFESVHGSSSAVSGTPSLGASSKKGNEDLFFFRMLDALEQGNRGLAVSYIPLPPDYDYEEGPDTYFQQDVGVSTRRRPSLASSVFTRPTVTNYANVAADVTVSNRTPETDDVGENNTGPAFPSDRVVVANVLADIVDIVVARPVPPFDPPPPENYKIGADVVTDSERLNGPALFSDRDVVADVLAGVVDNVVARPVPPFDPPPKCKIEPDVVADSERLNGPELPTDLVAPPPVVFNVAVVVVVPDDGNVNGPELRTMDLVDPVVPDVAAPVAVPHWCSDKDAPITDPFSLLPETRRKNFLRFLRVSTLTLIAALVLVNCLVTSTRVTSPFVNVPGSLVPVVPVVERPFDTDTVLPSVNVTTALVPLGDTPLFCAVRVPLPVVVRTLGNDTVLPCVVQAKTLPPAGGVPVVVQIFGNGTVFPCDKVKTLLPPLGVTVALAHVSPVFHANNFFAFVDVGCYACNVTTTPPTLPVLSGPPLIIRLCPDRHAVALAQTPLIRLCPDQHPVAYGPLATIPDKSARFSDLSKYFFVAFVVLLYLHSLAGDPLGDPDDDDGNGPADDDDLVPPLADPDDDDDVPANPPPPPPPPPLRRSARIAALRRSAAVVRRSGRVAARPPVSYKKMC